MSNFVKYLQNGRNIQNNVKLSKGGKRTLIKNKRLLLLEQSVEETLAGAKEALAATEEKTLAAVEET